MTQAQKTLERAMKEIERLKLQVLELKEKPNQEVKVQNVAPSSRLDTILKGRKSALERFYNKLFGGKNAKQK